MPGTKANILRSLKALQEESRKEHDAYEKRAGVFGTHGYVHKENLACYRATVEGLAEIVDYVQKLSEEDLESEDLKKSILDQLHELYNRQVRLRAGIGMAIRCISHFLSE